MQYKEAKKQAPKFKHRTVYEDLPPKYRKTYIRLRDKRRARAFIYNSIWKLDKKIYLHKIYPWSYKDYLPTLVLQGWYHEDKAKTAYYKAYGPKALEYVKFISGREALEKGFRIGKSLYINGKWRYIQSKGSILSHMYGQYERKKIIHSIKGRTLTKKRRNMDKELPFYQHAIGEEVVFENKSIKTARLQKNKAINTQRKKNLYLE